MKEAAEAAEAAAKLAVETARRTEQEAVDAVQNATDQGAVGALLASSSQGAQLAEECVRAGVSAAALASGFFQQGGDSAKWTATGERGAALAAVATDAKQQMAVLFAAQRHLRGLRRVEFCGLPSLSLSLSLACQVAISLSLSLSCCGFFLYG